MLLLPSNTIKALKKCLVCYYTALYTAVGYIYYEKTHNYKEVDTEMEQTQRTRRATVFVQQHDMAPNVWIVRDGRGDMSSTLKQRLALKRSSTFSLLVKKVKKLAAKFNIKAEVKRKR